jgi:hypothetical protein
MFFTKEVNTFRKIFEVYKPCFSKLHWNHFKTYLTGQTFGKKDEKNMQDIAGNLLDDAHQISLNRFINTLEYTRSKPVLQGTARNSIKSLR